MQFYNTIGCFHSFIKWSLWFKCKWEGTGKNAKGDSAALDSKSRFIVNVLVITGPVYENQRLTQSLSSSVYTNHQRSNYFVTVASESGSDIPLRSLVRL